MLRRRPAIWRWFHSFCLVGAFSFYLAGRFAAAVAPNMVNRRLSEDQSGRFLKNHVADPPMKAAEVQDKLRAGGASFLDRIRHFGWIALRGTDAYWEDRPDDVAAWIHYRAEQGGGAPNLFITGRCAEFHMPELRDI